MCSYDTVGKERGARVAITQRVWIYPDCCRWDAGTIRGNATVVTNLANLAGLREQRKKKNMMQVVTHQLPTRVSDGRDRTLVLAAPLQDNK
jgi:hypothetical protein